MKNLRLLAGFTAVLATSIVLTVACADQSSAVENTAARIERGRYLVMRSGLCIDCHSPRNERGEFIEAQHLAGAPILFRPTVPMPWVPAAPRLAGLPAGFTEEDLVHFLMTGERPHGRPAPLPPMPPYRFNHEDAAAIASYLHSLPPAPPAG